MQARITPQQFVSKWTGINLTERQTYQLHFSDVCDLLGFEKPMGKTSDGLEFIFERYTKEESGEQGYADVYLENHFAIEYKAPNKYQTLDEAYQQLQKYRERLKNPPLLVVTDINNWEIHTNFFNTEKKIYRFTNEQITDPNNQRTLRAIFRNPNELHPDRTAEQVTKEAAKSFKEIVDNMRSEFIQADADVIAHFLTKLVFCLFAEDVGLLPVMDSGRGLFSHIVRESRDDSDSEKFKKYVQSLFDAMNEGKDIFMKEVQYFNGSLFDDVNVVGLGRNARNKLYDASLLNWEFVEPTIFGTLFERAIDEQKRAQLGAHYTSRDDIMLIVEPVLLKPLRRQWATIREKADTARANYNAATTGKIRSKFIDELTHLRDTMLQALREITVLDPACGSGNFLYVALQSLLDFEQEVLTYEAWSRVPEIQLIDPQVHPRQMYGMEINPIAHALASIVVWIGYLQWKIHNGYRAMGRPILQDIHDNIRHMDAILAYDETGKPIEPEWQAVDVIIGNPPFLGAKKMRGELDDKYVDDLHTLYEGRLPGFTDLVAYWFERARTQLKADKANRIGFIATNSIGMGTNLPVLHSIKETGDIFMAWRDRAWILDGAAVRVAMLGFDNGNEAEIILDGVPVETINANLTATVDITKSKTLDENLSIAFIGTQKSGAFDMSENDAKKLLAQKNQNGNDNADVVRPWVNGSDIVRNARNMYNIYFPAHFTEEIASSYKAPFEYVKKHIKPARTAKHFENYPLWLHWRPRPEMIEAINSQTRYIITPRVSKYRLFAWMDKRTIPDSATVAIARDDDYFFGVLHSKLHEVWSLRMGTWLGKGNDPRYTPTTTFETFPFPYVPNQEDESAAAYQAIAAAAKQLHEERDAWLNPTPSPQTSLPQGARGFNVGSLKNRTLTNLYNALAVFRGEDSMKIKPEAGNFAPRLAELHDALDKAVCDAYGWEHTILEDEEEILRCLLALNLERAGG